MRSINHLAALLLCLRFTTPSQAMERGSNELSHEMGSPLRQTGAFVANPRSVLKTKTRALGATELPLSGSSLSSSSLSEEETKEEEEQNDGSPHGHAGELEVPNSLSSPEFAVVQQEHDKFHQIFDDLLYMKDPMPALKRLTEIAATMSDPELLYEFLETREVLKKTWRQVLAKLKDAMPALDAYKRAAADTINDGWLEQFTKDEQILGDIKEKIHKVYMPIFKTFVCAEPAGLFKKVKPQTMNKYIREDRDLFFELLHWAESLLGALEPDLDDLRDQKKAALEEADLGAFNLKIDDFINEKHRFISLLQNLKGSISQIRLAEKNYRVYSTFERKWEETFKKDDLRFQAFIRHLMNLEERVTSYQLSLDVEALSSAAIIRENPGKLPEVLGKIADLESDYASFFQNHIQLKPIHHVYDQLFKVKIQLQDIGDMHQLANACNEAFTKARQLEKGALAEFLKARSAFKKAWSQNLKALQLLALEMAHFGKATGESGSEAWNRLAAKERAFLRSYTGLSTLTSQWTIPALADYYDQRYQIPHRAAYRELLKNVDHKIKMASGTFSAVKTLRTRLADSATRAKFEESKNELEIQLREAQEAYKSLCASQEYEVYWDDERDEKDEEAYRVDVEQLSQLNQQLVGLGEDAGEILGQ